MENTEFVFGKAEAPAKEPVSAYTPGDFLRRFAAVVAICLGLAVLANAVVMMVGSG